MRDDQPAHGKFDAMASYLAPNYVTNLPGGRTVKKADVMKGMKKERGAISHLTWKRTITKLSVEKTTAMVEVKGDLKCEVKGQKGKMDKMELKAIADDVWKKINGHWLIISSSTKSLKMFINGKLMKGMR